MQPRVLFSVVFVWLSWSGGRFTAPFLEDEAQFSEPLVGLSLAVQSILISVLSSACGAFADKLEATQRHGRLRVLRWGIVIGTIAFMLHGVGRFVPLLNSSKALKTAYHFVLRVFYAIAISLINPVLDGLTLVHLEREGKDQTEFGKERLHGAIWWAISHVLIGPALDRWGFQVMYATTAIAATICFVVFRLYSSSVETTRWKQTIQQQDDDTLEGEKSNKDESSIYQSAPNATMFSILVTMCGTLYGVGFLFSYYTLNTGTSVVEQLIFLFFEYLGSSNAMCGLTVAVTVLFEIPIFQYAPQMLRLFGPGALMYIACLGYMTRVIGYTFIPRNQPGLILLLEPLHGVTYACSKTSSVELAAQLVPKGNEACGQGLLSLVGGFGIFSGLILGSILEDHFGSRVMYRSFAAIVATGMLIFGVADYVHFRYRGYSRI